MFLRWDRPIHRHLKHANGTKIKTRHFFIYSWKVVLWDALFSQDSHRKLYTCWVSSSHSDKLAVVAVPFLFGCRFVKTDYAFSLCSYWDVAYDNDVMDNRVGLNLLYAQVRGLITLVNQTMSFIFSCNSGLKNTLKWNSPWDMEPNRKSDVIVFVCILHLLCFIEPA